MERESFTLMLRSKTALGRLNDAEVHAVLDFMENIGFVHQAPNPEPIFAPADMTPAPPLPILPPPPSA